MSYPPPLYDGTTGEVGEQRLVPRVPTAHRLPEVEQADGVTFSAERDDAPRTWGQPVLRTRDVAGQDTAQAVGRDAA